jgi:hypothetical protein
VVQAVMDWREEKEENWKFFKNNEKNMREERIKERERMERKSWWTGKWSLGGQKCRVYSC